MGKIKIINDPVHGFITINSPLVHYLISHPWLQRLRNIKQLGLTYLVYPGACHNRFQHALGAMHLMKKALLVLKSKGYEITDNEAEAAEAAILLHDIGHGPFSHTLENCLINIGHEKVSLKLIEQINEETGGKLDLAIDIFKGTYHKQFFNDLINGQLDVDRLDYLRRDSFFSGVVEGMIGLERIINMLDICDNRLVVEAKGIYSVEKFLISRRFMYWQVYLHKTVISAEKLLISIINRAKYLSAKGEKLFATPSLSHFLESKSNDINTDLKHFVFLCDSDIESAITVWKGHNDKILSTLCCMLAERNLPRTMMNADPIPQNKVQEARKSASDLLGISIDDTRYFVYDGMVSNKAYSSGSQSVNVKYTDGRLVDIFEASDMPGASSFNELTSKYILCAPKHNL